MVAGTAELLPAAAAAAAGPARTSSTEPEILTAGLAPDGNIPEPDGADIPEPDGLVPD